jgi:hypothetical protein
VYVSMTALLRGHDSPGREAERQRRVCGRARATESARSRANLVGGVSGVSGAIPPPLELQSRRCIIQKQKRDKRRLDQVTYKLRRKEE